MGFTVIKQTDAQQLLGAGGWVDAVIIKPRLCIKF